MSSDSSECKLLGRGTFGSVHTVLSKHPWWHGQLVAEKIVDLRFLLELHIGLYVRPAGAMQIIRFSIDNELRFEMPLAEWSLFDILKSRRLSIDEIQKIFASIVTTVYALHQEKIAHLDIKPSNILYRDHKYLLADFGASIITQSSNKTSKRGTAPYRPFKTDETSGFSDDIWALGILLIQMLTGVRPGKPETTIAREKLRVKTLLASIEQNVHSSIHQLVKQLLTVNPEKRPKIDAVARHPFVSPYFVHHRSQLNVFVPPFIQDTSGEIKQFLRWATNVVITHRISALSFFLTVDLFYRYISTTFTKNYLQSFTACLAIINPMVNRIDTAMIDLFELPRNLVETYKKDVVVKLNGYLYYCPLYFDAVEKSLAHLKSAYQILIDLNMYRVGYKFLPVATPEPPREYALSELLV